MSSSKALYDAFRQGNIGKFQELLEVFKLDPNRQYGSNVKRSVFEKILSTAGSCEYIKLCLEYGADFYYVSSELSMCNTNFKNKIFNWQKNYNDEYPLHCVVESLCRKNVQQIQHLLSHGAKNRKNFMYVNVKRSGENSLHILAEKINDVNFQEIFEIMKILITHECNVNYPRKDDQTPFYMILSKQLNRENKIALVDYLLKNGDVDIYSHKSDRTIELIINLNPKFQLPKRVETNIDFNSMMELLNSFEINKFENLFSVFQLTCFDADAYQEFCAQFMEAAIRKGLINIVDLLINHEYDVNRAPVTSKKKISPAFLACSDAKPTILRTLLMSPKIRLMGESENRVHGTILHQFFEDHRLKSIKSDSRKVHMRTMTTDQQKCINLILDHQKCTRNLINELNAFGLPAIFYAVKFKNDYVTTELLKKGAYIGSVIGSIRKSLLEEFLDSTISTNDQLHDDDDFEIKIDYRFMQPPGTYDITKTCNTIDGNTYVNVLKKIENVDDKEDNNCEDSFIISPEVEAPQKIANNKELENLIIHPTIASFILLKWKKISFLVYINLLIVIMFIASFLPFAYFCERKMIAKIIKIRLKSAPTHSNEVDEYYHHLFLVLSYVTLSLLILREISQLALSVVKYICNYQNWIDMCLIGFALTFLILESRDAESEGRPKYYDEEIENKNYRSRLLRTIVILLSTAQYFNVIGMVPILSISIYTKMFMKVCLTFAKSLLYYSMLIIAFIFSFYNLHGDIFRKQHAFHIFRSNWTRKNCLSDDSKLVNETMTEDDDDDCPEKRFNNFFSLLSSVVKTVVMMTGEFDAGRVSAMTV